MSDVTRLLWVPTPKIHHGKKQEVERLTRLLERKNLSVGRRIELEFQRSQLQTEPVDVVGWLEYKHPDDWHLVREPADTSYDATALLKSRVIDTSLIEGFTMTFSARGGTELSYAIRSCVHRHLRYDHGWTADRVEGVEQDYLCLNKNMTRLYDLIYYQLRTQGFDHDEAAPFADEKVGREIRDYVPEHMHVIIDLEHEIAALGWMDFWCRQHGHGFKSIVEPDTCEVGAGA